MNQNNQKNVIVTGATSGIGEEIARKFASEGFTVALIGRRKEKGEKIVEEITMKGEKAFFIQADVANSESVKKMVKISKEKFIGSISVLVNNAGVNAGNIPIEYLSEEDWDKVLDTNLKGTFLCSKVVIPDMITNGGGSIINISSAGINRAYIGGAAYASAKSGVVTLTKIIAFEQGKNNIRTNCICPGSVHTEMFDGSIQIFAEKMRKPNTQAPSADQIFENIAKGIPLGRIGETQDVADLAFFLSTQEASFISGSVISIDGGQTL